MTSAAAATPSTYLLAAVRSQPVAATRAVQPVLPAALDLVDIPRAGSPISAGVASPATSAFVVVSLTTPKAHNAAAATPAAAPRQPPPPPGPSDVILSVAATQSAAPRPTTPPPGPVAGVAAATQTDASGTDLAKAAEPSHQAEVPPISNADACKCCLLVAFFLAIIALVISVGLDRK